MSLERDQKIADIKQDIEYVKLVESGASIGKDGELIGTTEQLNNELQNKNTLFGLEQEKEHLEEANLYEKASTKVKQTSRGIRNTGVNVNRWLANIPTPGGIWVPFFVLMFLFMVLFPVNGHTRMMWLWLVLTGNAKIGSLGQRGQSGSFTSAAVQSALNQPNGPGFTSGAVSSALQQGNNSGVGGANGTGVGPGGQPVTLPPGLFTGIGVGPGGQPIQPIQPAFSNGQTGNVLLTGNAGNQLLSYLETLID